MEVKEGYKKTEVGLLPNDWDIQQIGTISRAVRGGSPRPAGDPKYFNGDYIPWLTVAALTNISNSEMYVSETESYLTKEGSKHSRTLEKETLIIANSGATLGIAKILSIKSCANDGIAALLEMNKEVDKRYLVYYINTKTQYLREVVATGNGQPNLNTDLISRIKVPFPRTKIEQTTIATALSDADALINSLEKLIAKKQAIKQCTMQLLLTGKKRLPGFSGEWEVKRLGEVFNFLSTANNSRSDLNTEAEIGYIHYGDIHTKWKNFLDCSIKLPFYISKEKINGIPYLEEGDLVMADASEDYEGIGACVEIKNLEGKKVVGGLHTLLLRGDKKKVADGFKGYLRELPGVKEAFIRIATGISVYGISKSQLKNIEIIIPKIHEQQAIAQILNEMDREILLLEQKHSKYREVKQGMMQNLLTGIIRLV